jgi:hypothetical protein
MPSRLGDKSPRVTNTNEIVDEDEQSALAEVSGSLKDLLQSSLKCSRIKREMRRGWGPIYSPHEFMTIGGVKTSDISNLDRISLMGDSNWLEFGYVGYI